MTLLPSYGDDILNAVFFLPHQMQIFHIFPLYSAVITFQTTCAKGTAAKIHHSLFLVSEFHWMRKQNERKREREKKYAHTVTFLNNPSQGGMFFFSLVKNNT